MGFIPKSLAAALAVATTMVAVSGCGRESTPAQPQTAAQAPADYASAICDRVTIDAMMSNVSKLQAIADANDGNRAVGTSGYGASADYVADALRSKGFDVHMPEFELRFPFADAPVVTVRGSTVAAKPLEYTIGTAPLVVTGPLLPACAEDSPGTLDRLQSLDDDAFDTLWVTSMIGHHQGAIEMAQDEIARGQSADAVHVARLIITAQQREIAMMTHLVSASQ
jgi:predicted outer membrane protein